MKRRLFILLLGLFLLLSACGGKEQTATEETNPPIQPTVPSGQTDALSALREDMKPPLIAVADFGFPALSEEFGIMDYLWDKYPRWIEERDFIRNIPEERIVRTTDCYGDWVQLLCIVPRDPASTVSVTVTRCDPETYEQLETREAYHSETGEPIFLLADIAEHITVTVVVIDSEGRGVSWIPYWDNAHPIPEDGYYGALMMDFTPISEKTAYENAISQGWYVPELAELMGTEWLSQMNFYAMDLMDNSVPGDNGGWVTIYDQNMIGAYTQSYSGSWDYADGMLHLSLVPEFEDGYLVDDSFPVLMLEGELWIGRNEDGIGLPHFFENQQEDTLEQPKG